MISKKLEERCAQITALGFRPAAREQLQSYLELLWSTNEELNLISRKMTVDELVDNHVIDCLLPLSKFPPNLKNVADFGSGGGLPGVLYALQFPKTTFHLFEKSKMKQSFLNRCKEFAPNIHIYGEIPLELKNIDLLMARAFKPLDVLLNLSRAYYLKKGKYFLFKARGEKIEEEIMLARKKFKDLEVQIKHLSSPVLEVERNLLLIN